MVDDRKPCRFARRLPGPEIQFFIGYKSSFVKADYFGDSAGDPEKRSIQHIEATTVCGFLVGSQNGFEILKALPNGIAVR